MKKIFYILIFITLGLQPVLAQDRTVENRPYTDLRKFHLGVLVGTHLQDLEFMNTGPQTVTLEDGTTTEKTISVDQDRWDAGFTVGVLGEARISEHFQFRVAPAMYFGTRHITFHNYTDQNAVGEQLEQTQDMKSAYVSCALDLIAAAPRFNNHRPYIMAGINPMLNLTARDDDFIKLKKFDTFLEVGVGCDFYLPFFKLRPELKFMYGLSNCLDDKHASQLQDVTMRPYANAAKEAHSKMIALTFYFE